MFYAGGRLRGAPRASNVGCLTLHPSGLPHGPQPGTVEKALGAKSTNEPRGHGGTRFRPLRLSTLWRDNDDPSYAYSWNPDCADADAGRGRVRGERRRAARRHGHRSVGLIGARR